MAECIDDSATHYGATGHTLTTGLMQDNLHEPRTPTSRSRRSLLGDFENERTGNYDRVDGSEHEGSRFARDNSRDRKRKLGRSEESNLIHVHDTTDTSANRDPNSTFDHDDDFFDARDYFNTPRASRDRLGHCVTGITNQGASENDVTHVTQRAASFGGNATLRHENERTQTRKHVSFSGPFNQNGSPASQNARSSNNGSSANQDAGSSNNGSSASQNAESSNNGSSANHNAGSSNNGSSASQNAGSSNNDSSANQNAGSPNNGSSANQNVGSSNNGSSASQNAGSPNHSPTANENAGNSNHGYLHGNQNASANSGPDLDLSDSLSRNRIVAAPCGYQTHSEAEECNESEASVVISVDAVSFSRRRSVLGSLSPRRRMRRTSRHGVIVTDSFVNECICCCTIQ